MSGSRAASTRAERGGRGGPVPVLITRPREAGERLAAELAAAAPGRVEPILAPLIEIRPLGSAQIRPGAGEELVLTSAAALRALAGRLEAPGAVAWCVGPATAEAARAAGLAAQEAGADAASLAARLAALAPRRLLYLRGRH
ncbi:MAG: uroporphyrinogen-III synthase, partial [Alphaproteobacteria bacterium]